MKKIACLLFVILNTHGMQKQKQPIMVYEDQIIHLDLPGKYGWPETWSHPKKTYKRMMAMVESRIRNKQDVDIPITDRNGIEEKQTILYQAAQSDEYIDITKKLLYHGADPNRKNPQGCTELVPPLERAICCEAISTVELLLSRPNINPHASYRPLLHWVRGQHYSIETEIKFTELLLVLGCDPNAKDPYCRNRTPLFELACGSSEVRPLIYLLLEHGAQIDIEDTDHRTAVAYAQGSYNEMYKPEGAKIIEKEGPPIELTAALRKVEGERCTYFSKLPRDIVLYIMRRFIKFY